MKKIIPILLLSLLLTLLAIPAIAGSDNVVIFTQNLKTNEDLNNYAIEFLRDYNISLDNTLIPITFTNIEQTEENININGTFYFIEDEENEENREPIRIVIDEKLIEECEHEVERTLIHELTHYVLFLEGKGHRDGQMDFEDLNYKNGGRSNLEDSEIPILESKIDSSCCD